MAHKKIFKRKYEQKLAKRISDSQKNRDFLLTHLKREWAEIERKIERDKKKQKLVEGVRESGKILGLTILGMAAVCGVVVVAAVAPNVFSAWGRLGRSRRYFGAAQFKSQLSYLKKRRYVRVHQNTREIKITLRESGRTHVMKRTLENLAVPRQEQWDGVWRLVIFDIPEQHKWARDGLRGHLKRMGFYPIQKSTFAFPYPCREEIEFLRDVYDAGRSIRFFETTSLSIDDDIKNFFFTRQ